MSLLKEVNFFYIYNIGILAEFVNPFSRKNLKILSFSAYFCENSRISPFDRVSALNSLDFKRSTMS